MSLPETPLSPENPFAEATRPVAPADERLWLWTVDQLSFPASLLICLVFLWAGMFFFRYPHVAILIEHPLGIKMLVFCLAVLPIGLAGYLLWCGLINICIRPTSPLRKFAHQVLGQCALLIFAALFCLPAVLVVTIGPESIRIYENLMCPREVLESGLLSKDDLVLQGGEFEQHQEVGASAGIRENQKALLFPLGERQLQVYP